MTMRLLLDTSFGGRAVCLLFFFSFLANSSFANYSNFTLDKASELMEWTCDNLTDGGLVEADEEVFPDDSGFDPAIITNVTLPSGGSGTIEYLWIKTTDDPSFPNAQWTPIPGSNGMDYDPTVIFQTTWYRRCARRGGCIEYIAESNIVRKMVLPCDNVTAGGSLGFDQTGGCAPYDANEIINVLSPSGGTGNLEYLWFQSFVNVPFNPNDPNWTEIPNTNTPNYDPGILNQTTYFIRCSRREECTEYTGETNVIEITVENCCDNVTDGGSIGFDQTGCAPFDPAELINVLSPSGGTGALEYLWFSSTVGGPFSPTSPDWMEITNSNTPNFDPGPLTETTFFIRCSRRAGCTEYAGETNIIEITIEECCDNVTDGGSIGFDQTGCAPFDPAELINVLSPSGGTGALEYLWFSSTVGGPFSPTSPDWMEITNSNTPNFDPGPLTETTFFIRCSRRAGCDEYTGETNIIEITVLPSPDLAFTILEENTCMGDATADIDLTISGGAAPYAIQWNNGLGMVEDPQNLAAGDYTVVVTDANDCATELTVTVPDGSQLVLNVSSTGTGCQGGTTASATAAISGGVEPYVFQWNDANNQTTATATNLTVGTYMVTVTDANNCSIADMVEVVMGANIELTFEAQPETCDGDANGFATVNVNNGTPPYTYQWNDAAMQTTQTAMNLGAGNYEVTVTDATNCTAVGQVALAEGDAVKPLLAATNPSCNNGNDGTAMVDNILGGVAPYTFLWNDSNNQTTQTATNLTAGSYTVTVTDVNGCTGEETIELTNPSPVIVAVSGGNESCPNAADGSAMVSLVMNGTEPYSYLWNTGATTASIDNLPPANYAVTVTDTNGCIGTASIQVMVGSGLDIFVFGQNETCAGAGDGSATVTSISNGTAPFTYQWDDPNAQTTEVATGLTAGTYQVIVSDANGCTGSAGVILQGGSSLQLDLSAIDVLCAGGMDGSATATVSGGTPPYLYQWDDPNFQNTATANNLGFGAYTVTVADANGCSVMGSVTVDAPLPLDFDIQTTDATCASGNDGTAMIILANGNLNDYTFAWSDVNNSTTPTVTGLTAGNYMVTITDLNGCTTIGSTTINSPTGFTVMVTTTSATCSDASDGSATVTVSGGQAPLTYEWNDANNTTSTTLSNVLGGDYEVTITDGNGCLQVETVSIFAPNPLSLEFSSTNESCSGSADGTATVSITGGTSGYQITWDDANSSTTATAANLTAGTYNVTVVDANGCQITGSTAVGTDSDLAIEVTTTDLTCNDVNDGSTSVQINGGNAPFAIQWDDANNSTDGTINNLAAGFYNVTVTDANGCSATETAAIFEPAPINLTFEKTDVVCADDTNGAATANAMGGTAPYTYSWNDPANQTTQTALNLGVGVYTVTITDANGCEESATVAINFTSDLSTTITATDVACFGENSGIVEAVPAGGVAPFSYDWSANLGSANLINNLAAGTYSVTVTDGVGCTAVASITVDQPTALQCSAAISNTISNFDGSDGAIEAIVTGGTSTYAYLWSDGQTTALAMGLSAGNYTVTVTDNNGCTCVSTNSLDNPSKIGNMVWDDLNENGVMESDETGVEGVNVTLIGTTSSGAFITQTTVTDADGKYYFDGLEQGTYKIGFELPMNYQFTTQNAGADDVDSDPNPSSGTTDDIVLGVGECNNDIDAGIYQLDEKVNIGDFVWLDVNRNGVQDADEEGVQNVTVQLWSVLTNSVVDVQTTNFLGGYLFEDVTPGPYYIEFVSTSLPQSYVFTGQDLGGDDLLDSDVDTLTGQTEVFEIFIFDLDDLSFDAGVYAKCDNVTSGGSIAGNEELCGIGADPAVITNVDSPSGGFGTLEYLWLSSNIPIYNGQGDPNWTALPNSNTPFYNPGPITQTTYYIRCARRECCDDYPGESNIVKKEIKQVPLANIEANQNLACLNENVEYEATNAGFGAIYSWDFDGATPATGSTRVVSDVSWNTLGVKTVSLTVTQNDCSLTVTTNISIVTCNSPGNLVGFDDFYIDHMEQYMTLNWSMTDDLPGGLFYVQRGSDGDDFETIGMLQNENEVLEYQFDDENPRRGENYYRIRFVPFDGQRLDSDTQMAFLGMDNASNVNVYPNPFGNHTTIELLSAQEEAVRVDLTNNFGQVIQSIEIPAGEKKFELDGSELPVGVYFLQIQQEGRRTRVERIFKAD